MGEGEIKCEGNKERGRAIDKETQEKKHGEIREGAYQTINEEFKGRGTVRKREEQSERQNIAAIDICDLMQGLGPRSYIAKDVIFMPILIKLKYVQQYH